MKVIKIKDDVVIAIIDSGIDNTVNQLGNHIIDSIGFDFSNNGDKIEMHTNITHRHPHGTRVATIIKNSFSNVKFIDINILDENLSSDGRILIRAFNQAISYKPDIIHMSLGTNKWRYKHQLKKSVLNAIDNKIIVVSAADNSGAKSYPAYLNNVIGVKDSMMAKTMYYSDDFFYAPGNTYIKNSLNKKEMVRANSFAAAYITGEIAKLIYKNDIQGDEKKLRI